MPAHLPCRPVAGVLGVLLVLGLLAGCGSPGSVQTKTDASGSEPQLGAEGKAPTTPTKARGCRTAAKAAKLDEAPEVAAPKRAERSFRVADDILGCGALVGPTSTITVHYVLKSRSSADVVDSSWTRGQPFTTTLGQGQVIPGWDHALVGMRAGGRRTILLGPDEAYGAEGRPPAIAGNDTLLFVIDLLSVGSDGADATSTASSPPTEPRPTPPSIPATPADVPGCRTPQAAAAETTAPDPAPPTEAETSIKVTDDIAGCGDLVGPTSTVSVQYLLKARSTGQTVDSSWSRNEPFDVQLGQGQVIAGWDDGLPGMRAGGRRTLVVGPDFAYGAVGRPPQIGASDTLLFVVDVLKVS